MSARILSIVVFAWISSFASAQVHDTLTHSIPPPLVGTAGGGNLGSSVAVFGDVVITGVPGDGTGGNYSGAVKIFSASTGALLQVLPNPEPTEGALFGTSVAISGTRVFVGASGFNSARGRVYVFDLSAADPAVPVLRVDGPTNGPNTYFGAAVAASGDTFVVGAPRDSGGAIASGTVHVFSLLSPTPAIPLVNLSSPTPADNFCFGSVVAIDGRQLVVGTGLFTGSPLGGEVFVFDLAGFAPGDPILRLSHPSSRSEAQFGRSVSISGHRVVVGAGADSTVVEAGGAVFVYDITNATPAVPVVSLPNPDPQRGAGFGAAVSVSGSRLLVGAFQGGGELKGAAYAFDLAAPSPASTAVTLPNPTPPAAYQTDWFGWSVAVSGATAVVGTPQDDTLAVNAGSAYVFDLSAVVPGSLVAVLTSAGPSAGDQFGSAVAVSGRWLAVGSPFESIGANHAGAAYVYDLNSATPNAPAFTFRSEIPEVDGEFGTGIAVTGNRLIVSAPGAQRTAEGSAGRVYVYDLTSANPGPPILTLSSPVDWGGRFGTRIALSDELLAVSRYGRASSVHVFDLASATPSVPVPASGSLQSPFSSPFTDYYGDAIAISGQRVIVGARWRHQPLGRRYGGFAASYNLSVSPASELELSTPTAGAYEYLGDSVALSGNRVMVSAPGLGKTFLYDLASATPAQSTQTFPGSGCALSGTLAAIAGSQGVSLYDLGSSSPTTAISTAAPPTSGIESFGSVLATDGTRLAVGAPLADTVMVDKGFVYVYGAASTPLPPEIYEPAPHSNTTGPLTLAFFLPKVPRPGSLKVIVSGAQSRTLTLAATQEVRGRRSLKLDARDLGASSSIARVDGGDSLPEGTYEFRVSYRDLQGNLAETGAVPDVRVDRSTGVVDTTPPQVQPMAARELRASATGVSVLPDFRSLLTATDDVGVTRILQQPAPGTPLTVGRHAISFAVRDAAGNVASVASTVVVRFTSLNAAAATPARAVTGAPVPGAGTQSGIPGGAVFSRLQSPAISDLRDLAVLATVASGRKRLDAVYREDAAGVGEILAIEGGPVPGPGGVIFTCKSLLNPVLAPDGSIAFSGKLAGVKTTEDEAVWTDVFGPLQLVLRQGAAVPGLSTNVTLKSVTTLSLRDHALLALVRINRDRTSVSAANDTALVLLTGPTTGHLLMRTGPNALLGSIKGFTVLSAPLGSAGQGRSHNDAFAVVKAISSDGRTAVISISPTGTQTIIAASGDNYPALIAGAKWATFGPPSTGGTGNWIAAVASLQAGVGGVSTADNEGIATATGAGSLSLVAREGKPIDPGTLSGGPAFSSFYDPVVNAEGRCVFLASITGGGAKRSDHAALFSGSTSPQMLACLGRPALSTDGIPLPDTQWSGFLSYAVRDGGGALFLASLQGRGVKRGNNLGLWAEDPSGVARLVLRTGTEVDFLNGSAPRTLADFTLLNPVPGAFGARRSYNATGSAAVVATFAEGGQGLLRVDLP